MEVGDILRLFVIVSGVFMVVRAILSVRTVFCGG